MTTITPDNSKELLTVGTQIIYVPLHAKGNVNHSNAERGFVTSISDDGATAWCRYWYPDRSADLRTVANSEGTPIEMLVIKDSIAQRIIDRTLNSIAKNQRRMD